jgi:four helix bundle protein
MMKDEGRGMTEEKKRKFDLEDRLIDYAVSVIGLCDALPSTPAGRHVGGQLLRSGTSPAPNYGEAQSAESPADFIHKLRICLKELRESNVWLKMIVRANLLPTEVSVDFLLRETNELISILVKSIQTAQRNRKTKTP